MRAIVPWDVGSYPYAEINYANPHAVTSVGGATYTYDNNGNVTAIGSLDYTWDWRNRLANAERSGGGITSYGYDHAGQRVFKAKGRQRRAIRISITTSPPRPDSDHDEAHLLSGRHAPCDGRSARRQPPRRTYTPITSAGRTSPPMRMGK